VKKIILLSLVLLLSVPASSLTLVESRKIAFENNPSIVSASKKLEASMAKVSQAGGAFLPNLKVQASTGQVYSKPTIMEFTTIVGGKPVTQTVEAGVNAQIPSQAYEFSLSQPLFTGGKLLSALSMAQKNYDMSYQEYRKTVFEVDYNTIYAYLSLVKAEEYLALAEKSQKTAEEHINQIKNMLYVGTATKADLLRSEVEAAKVDVMRTRAKNAVISAQNALQNALGIKLDDIKTSHKDFSNENGEIPEYEEIIKIAYKNRPEWLQFLSAQELAESNANLAKSDFFPSFALMGTYGSTRSQYPTFTTDGNSWKAMLAGSWTLFDMTIPAKAKEAQLQYEAQKANKDALKNMIDLETKNTYLEILAAKDVLNSSQKAYTLANENFAMAEARYNAGIAINLEVIDAQVSQIQSGIDLLQAKFDLKLAKAKLNKIIGKEVL